MNTYQIITEAIVRDLRRGIIPWRKPWTVEDGGTVNYVSRRPYSFLNKMLLSRPGEYLTRNQMLELGGTFRPSGLSGEELERWGAERYDGTSKAAWWHGLSADEKDQMYQSVTRREIVTFYKPARRGHDEIDEQEGAETSGRNSYPVLRFYAVYHISDILGIPSRLDTCEDGFATDRRDAGSVVERYVSNTGVRIVTSATGDPGYRADEDTILIPSSSRFTSEEARLSTLFHNLVHSTGKEGRLARRSDGMVEELTAEMGAAMICTQLQLDSQDVWDNQLAYIQTWIGELEKDSRLVTRAASAAEKAVGFILGGGTAS